MTGGRANIIIATTPGVKPTPKSITTGIKYTKLGIVCITSKAGLSEASKKLLLDERIPKGIPIKQQKITAVIIIAIVVIVSSQMSNKSIKIKLRKVKIANFKLFVL